MIRFILPLLLTVASFGQYKAEPAGPPPSELAPEIAATLQKEGTRIVGPDGAIAEIWFRSILPTSAKTTEDSVTFTTVPHGSLMGAIRFASRHSDRRGQTIYPGLYTMRLSFFPQDGNHQGVAPQRDFLLLVPAAEDKDPKATPSFKELAKWSQKASKTPHPAVFSVWKAPSDSEPGISQGHEGEWVLHGKVGDTPIAMIVVGTAAG